jgi:hypothetical protein
MRPKRLQRRLKKLNAPWEERPLPPTAATARQRSPPLTYSGFVHRIKMWLMYAAARHGNIDLFSRNTGILCPYYDDFNNMVVMDGH